MADSRPFQIVVNKKSFFIFLYLVGSKTCLFARFVHVDNTKWIAFSASVYDNCRIQVYAFPIADQPI